MITLTEPREEVRRVVETPARVASRLANDVRDRMRASPYLAIRSVECVESREGVTLLGQLPSHYLKQMAQETALNVAGVRAVVNQVRVQPASGLRRRWFGRSNT